MKIASIMRKTTIWLCAGAFLAVLPVVPASARDGEAVPPPAITQPKKKKPAPKTAPAPKAPAKAAPVRNRKPATTERRPARRVVRRLSESAPSGMPPDGETQLIADQVVVRYRLDASQRAMDALVARLGLRHLEGRTFTLAGATLHRYAITNGTPVRQVIAGLEADGTVVYAQPNYVYALQQAAKGASGMQYAFDRMAFGDVHDTTRGKGAVIAIIDSAVDVSHPGLADADLELVDVSDGDTNTALSHGTAIAGIVSASGTVTGIAPDARVVAIAAFSKTATGDVLGNSWTVAKAADIAHENKAQVINMSFAGPEDPLMSNTIKGLARRGVVMFAASGNEGPDAGTRYPAGYDEVQAVTATDSGDAVYARANRGAHLAFSAPGVEVLSLAPGAGYDVQTGTSIATAHLTGLAALMLAGNSGLGAGQVTEALQQAARDLGEPGRDPVYGFGIPDAGAAMRKNLD